MIATVHPNFVSHIRKPHKKGFLKLQFIPSCCQVGPLVLLSSTQTLLLALISTRPETRHQQTKSKIIFTEPVHEKTNNLGSDQGRDKPVYTVTEES